ncbi:MAG TPA: coenzyme F420 hydrogenase [Desulfurococcales archaeon]|nr:coenzyme F420 hydrogenase [Desulfurococcales archaeon]
MSFVSLDKPLGDYVDIVLARAIDETIRRQRIASGGAVTALLTFMLERGYVDGVVVAKRVHGLQAELVIAKSRREILEAAGNKWSVLPYTTRLREALHDESLKSIALVGLPCQAQFLWQMKTYPLLETDFVSKIYFIVSLFCLGTFATEAFIDLLKLKYGLKPEKISAVSLEKNYIKISYNKSEKRIPLAELLPYIQTGCLTCSDYAGVFSDISAGLSENYPGYTVLILRCEKAVKLVNEAKANGYIEVEKANLDVIEEIETKARGKIVRATRYMSLLL